MLSRVAIEVADGDEPWVEVSSLESSGPEDRHYVVREVDGRTTVYFGDGEHGRRPLPGETTVTASYGRGSGSAGDVAVRVTLARRSGADTHDRAFRTTIRAGTRAVSFEACREVIDGDGQQRRSRTWRPCGWASLFSFVAGTLAGHALRGRKPS
jgi:hypothetical protein